MMMLTWCGSGGTDRWMDTELLLISPDRLAHVWRGLRHMNFYHRVDIDQFLVPN